MRTPKPVDKAGLQAAINAAESKGPLKNRSVLWTAIENSEWGESNGVTAGIARLRFEEFGLTCKTPLGRKVGVPITPAGAPRKASDPIHSVRDNSTNEGAVLADSHTKGMKIDLTPFTKRGIEVNSAEDLLTSIYKDDATNRAISEAYRELREKSGHPAPYKIVDKTGKEV